MPDQDIKPQWSAKQFSGVWVIISVIVLGLMSLHSSSPAAILGRYSTQFAGLLAITAAVSMALAMIFALAATKRLPSITIPFPKLLSGLVAVVGFSIMMIFAYLLRTSIDAAPLLFLGYISALMLSSVIFVYDQLGTRLLPTSQWWLIIIMGLVVIVVAWQTNRYIGATPTPRYYDEAWIFNRAYSYVEYGTPNQSSIYGVRTEPLNTSATLAVMGIWLTQVSLSFEQGRFFLLLLGYLTIALCGYLAWRIYGKAAAIVAVCMGLFIPLIHNYLRANVTVSLVTAITMICLHSGRQSKPKMLMWQDILAGFAAGFAIEGHVYGISVFAAFGLIYFWQSIYDWRQNKSWLALRSVISYSLGGLGYIVFFIFFRIPATFASPIDWLNSLFARYNIESSIGSCRENILLCIPEFYTNYISVSPIEIAIAVFAIVAVVWRLSTNQSHNRQFEGTTLAAWILSSIFLMIALTKYNPYYWIYNLPFVIILGGAGLASLTGSNGQAPVRLGLVVSTLGVVLILAASTTFVMERSYQGHLKNVFSALPTQIASSLPENTPTVGNTVYYIAQPRNPYYYDVSGYAQSDRWGPLPVDIEAVIITFNIDHSSNILWDLVKTEGLELVHCYPEQSPTTAAVLFVAPEILQDDPVDANDCADWVLTGLNGGYE